MGGQSVFKALIWLGQKLPASWRVALTYSPAAAWLRRFTLLPLTKGQVVVALSGPLTGYRMKLDIRSGHRRYALGTYEPHICTLIQSYLHEGETVMDIGANIGYFTLLMASKVGPQGRVIAFEPVPTVYNVLLENLRLNASAHVCAECQAVAEVEDVAYMQSDTENPLSFVGHLSESGDLEVKTITVDDYVHAVGLNGLDFVKIDVEGAEDHVLQGMINTLKYLKPTILLEMHANDGGNSLGLCLLKQEGYQLLRVEKDGLFPCYTRAQGGYILGRWRG